MPDEKKMREALNDDELEGAVGGAGPTDVLQSGFLRTMRLRCPKCSRRLQINAVDSDLYRLACNSDTCGFTAVCSFSDAIRYIL